MRCISTFRFFMADAYFCEGRILSLNKILSRIIVTRGLTDLRSFATLDYLIYSFNENSFKAI